MQAIKFYYYIFKDWNGLNPDPVEGTDIGESFYDIPDPDEMKALTECIRGTLKDNSVSKIDTLYWI